MIESFKQCVGEGIAHVEAITANIEGIESGFEAFKSKVWHIVVDKRICFEQKALLIVHSRLRKMGLWKSGAWLTSMQLASRHQLL